MRLVCDSFAISFSLSTLILGNMSPECQPDIARQIAPSEARIKRCRPSRKWKDWAAPRSKRQYRLSSAPPLPYGSYR